MSWQAYIDTQLISSGNVDEAGIFSKNGVDMWASSPNFKISTAEMEVIVNSFDNADSIHATGFKINNEKYTVVRSDDQVLMGRKGKEGVVVVKTKQALILGHHPDTIATQQCAQTVEGLGDYLSTVGF